MRVTRPTLPILAALALWAAAPATATAEEEGLGASEYAAHCAVCHAIDGRGNGPYGMFLKVAPSDLTMLAAENGGRFPFEDVYRIIDGRTELLAHGPREMPIWGYEYRRLAMREGKGATAEKEVSKKILALIEHIRTLQRDE